MLAQELLWNSNEQAPALRMAHKGGEFMAQLSTRGLLASAAASALLLAAPAGVRAEPISLSQSVSVPGGPTLSGNLHGDLSGDVLTLNASAPKSDVTIDASHIVGPLPPMAEDDTVFDGLGIRIVAHLDVTPSVTVPAWQFGLGGTMDFGAGTANLTVDLLAAVIANVTAAPTVHFSGSVDPGLGPIQHAAAQALLSSALAALNAPDVEVDIASSAAWTSIVPGPASAALTQDGSGTTVDLGLTSALLAGLIESNVTITAPNVPDFLGAPFLGVIDEMSDRALHEAIVMAVMETLDEIDGSIDGLGLNCQTPAAGGRHRTGLTCNLSAAFSFTGGAPVASVPEPATLGAFGAGLAALAFARRRRRGPARRQ